MRAGLPTVPTACAEVRLAGSFGGKIMRKALGLATLSLGAPRPRMEGGPLELG